MLYNMNDSAKIRTDYEKKIFSFMRVKQFSVNEIKRNSLVESSFFYPTVFIHQNVLVRHSDLLKPDYRKG
jgi:hypothetical protein